MVMKILVADRQLVRPGDCIAILEEPIEPGLIKHIPDKHVFIVGNKVYSDVLGIVYIEESSITIVPLESVYIPRKDDIVIGVISSIGITAWNVDIRSPYEAILPASDVIEGFNPITHNLRNYLDIGDMILARVVLFDRTRDPVLSIKGKGLGKIIEGTVIEIKPSKIARVIGKKGSMLNVLTSMTKCDITVALNGYIWAKCPNDRSLRALMKALRLIEAKAHMRGLTEEVKNLLTSELRGVL
ncbi:MAG: exosome complex RNA-binding protein Rrp4 [Desulfurococcaceae archaeon]